MGDFSSGRSSDCKNVGPTPAPPGEKANLPCRFILLFLLKSLRHITNGRLRRRNTLRAGFQAIISIEPYD